jgi:four helix bundle protein
VSESYRDLKVWQSAVALALEIYRATKSFPADEIYVLSSQMRRAAVSIASNIAEGKGRSSRKELLQFLFRARGSMLELETQITIASELKYFNEPTGRNVAARASETARMLNGLIRAFEDRQ